MASLVSAEAPKHLDGMDLSALLLDKKPLAERKLYWAWGVPIKRWALRHGDWKIVRYATGNPENAKAWQLYNLKEDPKETTDLAAKEPDKLEDMHQLFLKQRAQDLEK